MAAANGHAAAAVTDLPGGPRGRRLLPHVVDGIAAAHPDRVYLSYARSRVLADGFRDVTYAQLAKSADHVAAWLEAQLHRHGACPTVCYMGLPDIRYTMLLLAAVKLSVRLLLVASRNTTAQNVALLSDAGCRCIVHSEKFDQKVADINQALPVRALQIEPLEHILDASASTPHRLYPKRYQDVVTEPVLYLHSSGSTGHPKLVPMTHGSFAVVDRHRDVPHPPGRKMQNASLLNFDGESGRFYAPFPPFHLAGVQSFISVPIFSDGAIPVLGPIGELPSGFMLAEIMRHVDLRALYAAPSIIEQWASVGGMLEKAKSLDFIIYGGGPLAPQVGAKLASLTQVCQTYGSIETGGMQLLVPRPEEWQYLEFNPFEEADMQDQGDGTSELVLHQREHLKPYRALTYNKPGLETWRTGDLFSPHPDKPGLWKFATRVDDLIVMSNGLKLRPGDMELAVLAHPGVSGVLVCGHGRPQPAMIIEPAQRQQPGVLGESVWPLIDAANKSTPTYGQIAPSKIIIGSPDKPFVRAGKGTVIRKLTADLYQAEIEALYDSPTTSVASPGRTEPNRQNLEAVRDEVRQLVQRTAPDAARHMTDDDDFFVLGMTSISMSELAHNLRARCAPSLGSRDRMVSLRLVYQHPSVRQLARALDALIEPVAGLHEAEAGMVTSRMAQVIADRTASLPPRLASPTPIPDSGLEILLTGATGTLGPGLVRALVESQRVARIHCLHRSTTDTEGSDRMHREFEEAGLGQYFKPDMLTFHRSDLSAPRLGLDEQTWDSLCQRVHVVVHNAWHVSFANSFDFYAERILPSITSLLELCAVRGARLCFSSSTSVIHEARGTAPGAQDDRDPLDLPLEQAAGSLGYAQSKLAAEHILAQAARACQVPVRILRVNQVAGPSSAALDRGERLRWSRDEWVPAMLRLGQRLEALPLGFAEINWTQSDVVADAYVELALLSDDASPSAPVVLNMTHPHPVPMEAMLDALRASAKTARVEAVTLDAWVQQLQQEQHKLAAGDAQLGRLGQGHLPFFEHLRDVTRAHGGVQQHVEAGPAMQMSRALRQAAPIDRALLERWFAAWGL